jgi:predicted RNA-binding Zn-ribbon protein involved in translation (DUF1610 family)
MKVKCPGSDVEITIKECPFCGGEVELFTGESKAKCPDCGRRVTREPSSCIEWCPGAEQCFSHVFAQESKDKKKEGEQDS